MYELQKREGREKGKTCNLSKSANKCKYICGYAGEHCFLFSPPHLFFVYLFNFNFLINKK